LGFIKHRKCWNDRQAFRSISGQFRGIKNVWWCAKENLTTEEINNKLLLTLGAGILYLNFSTPRMHWDRMFMKI